MSNFGADHPVWKLARLAIVCGTMLLFFGLIYKQPIEWKDAVTIIGTLSALAGYDAAKSMATK